MVEEHNRKETNTMTALEVDRGREEGIKEEK